MPFTFAHPLFAAPLKAVFPKYISLTGLILGSMSPDFEYFIALEPYQSIGHSTAGLFLQAIPLSILFAILFHKVIKIPLAEQLRSALSIDESNSRMLGKWQLNNIRSWCIFTLSVVLGFYSHILIDAFTHQSGHFVTWYPFLQTNIVGIPVYKLLQHTLSIGGLSVEAVILLFILHRSRKSSARIDVKAGFRPGYWFIVLLAMITTITLKFIFSSSTNYIGMLVVASISGFFIGLVIASIVYRKEKIR